MTESGRSSRETNHTKQPVTEPRVRRELEKGMRGESDDPSFSSNAFVFTPAVPEETLRV